MSTKLFLIIISVVVSINIYADHSMDKFCREVPSWGSGERVPTMDHYVSSKVGTPIEASVLYQKMGSTDLIVIDVRSTNDVIMGKIPKTYHLPADYNEIKENKFTKENILKVVNFHINKHKLGNPLTDVKNFNRFQYAFFCNGIKCHRSTWAACEMRKLGVSFENIFIYLNGFPDWRQQGYPIR